MGEDDRVHISMARWGIFYPTNITLNILDSTNIPSNTEEPLGSEPNCSNRPDFDTTTAAFPAPATSEALAATQVKTRTCHDKQIMPCKLLSRLAENPATDITQVPVPPGSVDPLQDATYHGGDVECGKAHELLMRYAILKRRWITLLEHWKVAALRLGRLAVSLKRLLFGRPLIVCVGELLT